MNSKIEDSKKLKEELTFINIASVRAAGKINDILTIIKIIPLILLIFGGIFFFVFNPGTFVTNYIPFAPLGFNNFGTALVLIFWAYAGFTPKTDISHLKELFISEENIFVRRMEKKERFLANFIRLLHNAYRNL